MNKLPSTIYMPYPSVTTSVACLSGAHLHRAIREALRIYFDSECDNGIHKVYAPFIIWYGLLACEEQHRRNISMPSLPPYLLFKTTIDDMQWELCDIETPPYNDTDAQATRQHLMSQQPEFYFHYHWTTP